MRKVFAYLLVSVSTLLFQGCSMAEHPENNSKSQSAEMMQEATLTSLSLPEKKQIEGIISHWFGGVDVTIASNAFVESSTISIERKSHEDERGLPINGRHNNPAFTFTMFKQGDLCLLRYNQTGATSELNVVSCTY